MMKFTFLIACALYTLPSFADVIDNQMNLRVHQGVCQKTWIENRSTFEQVWEIKNSNQKLVAVPCSMWSYNMAWSVFLKIDIGRSQELVKPLFFIRHSSYKGLYADSVLENISWDPAKEELTSKKHLNGRTHCGELAGYKWNQGAQDFKTISIYKNDDCSQSDAPWDKVL